LATELLSILNISSEQLQSMSIKDIITKIKDVTPSVKRGDSLHDEAIQKICHKLAESINRLFKGTGSGIIPSGLSCKDKYIKSKEILDSLFVGLHVEFLNIAKGVKDTSDDLQTIFAYLDQVFNVFIVKLKESEASKISKQEIHNLEYIYKNLRKEGQRLLEMLANYINISVGDYPSLEKLFTDKYLERVSSRISKNLKISEKEFNKALVSLLSGYKDIVVVTERTLDSLEKLNLDPNDLKKSASELKKIINNKFINIGVDAMDSKKEIKGAVEFLQDLLSGDSKKDVLKELKRTGKIKGGFRVSTNDNRPLRERIDPEQEESNTQFYTRKVLDTFSEGFHSLNYKFLNNIEKLSEEIIAGRIKSTKTLEKFIKFFIQIDEEYLVANLSDSKAIRVENLSGLSTSLIDISKKEKYISYLRAIMNLAKELFQENKNSIFNEISDSIQQILSFMGKYNDIVAKTLINFSFFFTISSSYKSFNLKSAPPY